MFSAAMMTLYGNSLYEALATNNFDPPLALLRSRLVEEKAIIYPLAFFRDIFFERLRVASTSRFVKVDYFKASICSHKSFEMVQIQEVWIY